MNSKFRTIDKTSELEAIEGGVAWGAILGVLAAWQIISDNTKKIIDNLKEGFSDGYGS